MVQKINSGLLVFFSGTLGADTWPRAGPLPLFFRPAYNSTWYFFFFQVLGLIKPSALFMLAGHSTTELPPSLSSWC